jgi:hypothetical protein
MKYCIGCIHLRYDDKEMAAGSSWTGAWTDQEAAISCGKKHWQMYLREGPIGGFDMENAMRHAATCNDYEERPAPSESVTTKEKS